jgi:hypothetical protein
MHMKRIEGMGLAAAMAIEPPLPSEGMWLNTPPFLGVLVWA